MRCPVHLRGSCWVAVRAASTFWAGTSFWCPCLLLPTVGSTAGFSLMFTVRAWSIPWRLTKLVWQKEDLREAFYQGLFQQPVRPPGAGVGVGGWGWGGGGRGSS